MNTNQKCDYSELKVMADLAVRGYAVLKPMSSSLKFDIVAYKDGRFNRIQIKYCSKRSGALNTRLQTVIYNSNGCKYNTYTENDIDTFAIYCPDTDACYYIPVEEVITTWTITLRIDPPKNNIKSVRWAKDYQQI